MVTGKPRPELWGTSEKCNHGFLNAKSFELRGENASAPRNLRILKSHLVFDSQLTTHAGLAQLDEMNIPFITLRRRSPKLLREIVLLPRSAWRTVELQVPTRKFRTPRVFEQTISVVGRSPRQLFVLDLGHEEPTILLTNQRHTTTKALLTRYAQMLIENALSDAVRFFHIDALSSAVGMMVDFELSIMVLAWGLYSINYLHMLCYT